MSEAQVYQIGRHRVAIACRDGVGPPTLYSLFLAEHIPEMAGQTAVDLGTGSGILAIVARLQGAARVYLLDTNAVAIEVALANAERNAVQDGLVPLPTGKSMLPLPAGEKVHMVICNPAQLPLPAPDRVDSAFYAGGDGRLMIDGIIREAHERLLPSGRLLMTHNSLTGLPKSLRLMASNGLETRILAERSIEFRQFIDRDWIDRLGGTGCGLYTMRDGRAYETLYIVEARPRL
jgi:release factor glutamine methyltransferase